MNTPKWHVLQNTLGQWYWHKRSGNGEITAIAQAFASKSDAIRAAGRDAWIWFHDRKYNYDADRTVECMKKSNAIIIHEPRKENNND